LGGINPPQNKIKKETSGWGGAKPPPPTGVKKVFFTSGLLWCGGVHPPHTKGLFSFENYSKHSKYCVCHYFAYPNFARKQFNSFLQKHPLSRSPLKEKLTLLSQFLKHLEKPKCKSVSEEAKKSRKNILNQVQKLDAEVPTVDTFSLLLLFRDAIHMQLFKKHIVPNSYFFWLGDFTFHFGKKETPSLLCCGAKAPQQSKRKVCFVLETKQKVWFALETSGLLWCGRKPTPK